MNILILRSVAGKGIRDPYSLRMDTGYAGRVIGHLTDTGDYCSSCGKECISCRKEYHLDFSGHIAGIIDFPAIVPAVLEEPETYIPRTVPSHDILLAIAVNEEILISFIQEHPLSRGIIVPVEGSDWITPHGIKTITELCNAHTTAVSFPKPFCSFDPADGVLREFRELFRIGKPDLEYTIQNDIITHAAVRVSAPCGATYFTARGLNGRRIDDDLQFIIDKQLNCYPCTADTAVDREFKDSITHQAVKIQRDVLVRIKKEL